VGFGHTSAAGAPKVTKGMRITAEEASDILVKDLVKYEMAVKKALTRAPNENQFAAMVSLCYNIGPGAFARSSVARLFNAGDVSGAADAFGRWNKAGGKVLNGLVRRRADERALFLTPVSKPAPQPLPEPAIPAPEKPVQPDLTARGPSIAKIVIGAVAALIAAFAAWLIGG
jgi:lysozyme